MGTFSTLFFEFETEVKEEEEVPLLLSLLPPHTLSPLRWEIILMFWLANARTTEIAITSPICLLPPLSLPPLFEKPVVLESRSITPSLALDLPCPHI